MQRLHASEFRLRRMIIGIRMGLCTCFGNNDNRTNEKEWERKSEKEKDVRRTAAQCRQLRVELAYKIWTKVFHFTPSLFFTWRMAFVPFFCSSYVLFLCVSSLFLSLYTSLRLSFSLSLFHFLSLSCNLFPVAATPFSFPILYSAT